MDQPAAKKACIRVPIAFECSFNDVRMVKVELEGGYGFEVRVPCGGVLLFPYVDAETAVGVFLTNCKANAEEDDDEFVVVKHKSGHVLVDFKTNDKIELKEAAEMLAKIVNASPYNVSNAEIALKAAEPTVEVDVVNTAGWGE